MGLIRSCSASAVKLSIRSADRGLKGAAEMCQRRRWFGGSGLFQ